LLFRSPMDQQSSSDAPFDAYLRRERRFRVRRFPAPWSIEAIDCGFKIVDSNGRALAYVYGHADPRDAAIAKGLILDEARRIAANTAKLPYSGGEG
jgi:hypothetical protein